MRTPVCLHALCNENLLLELKFLWEEEHERRVQQLCELLLEFNQTRQAHGALNERQFKRALSDIGRSCGGGVTAMP